jgi:hypothetical protein
MNSNAASLSIGEGDWHSGDEFCWVLAKLKPEKKKV